MSIKDRYELRRLKSKVARDAKKLGETSKNDTEVNSENRKEGVRLGRYSGKPGGKREKVKKVLKTILTGLSSVAGKLSAAATRLTKRIADTKKHISLGITNDNFSDKAKAILKKYVDSYEELTVNSLEEFIKFSEGYNLKVIDRFKLEYYSQAFASIERAGKVQTIDAHGLNSMFEAVRKYTHQGGASGTFMDPFTAFVQSLMRLPIPVKNLIKYMTELSKKIDDGDKEKSEKIILQVQFTLVELQDKIYENPAELVDEKQLLEPDYFEKCTKNLTKFSRDLGKLLDKINCQKTDTRIQREFITLCGECKG